LSRRLLVLLLLAFGLMVVPSAASAAKVNVAVGIGDQSPRMFDDANFNSLGLTKTRYFIEWNAIDRQADMLAADRFVDAARAHGVKVLMHISTDDINSVPRRPLPSLAQYKTKVRKLISHYGKRIRDWGVWNEANHKSQPTSSNPKRAAEFYRAFKGMCSGCRIVALDVLDQKGVESYIKRWMKAAGPSGRTARIIGVHNYSQVNRKITEKNASARYPGVARILAAIRKSNKVAKLWLTETGGLASFGSGFPCDLNRQASRTKYMFDLIKTYDKVVERLYSYNWFGAGCSGSFDGGLVEADGTVRPAFTAFKRGLKNTQK